MRTEEENKKDVHHPAPLHGIFVSGKKLGSNFFVLLIHHAYPTIYASTVTRPLGLVTLTPSALALAMMSTRLREETAEAILFHQSVYSIRSWDGRKRTQRRRCGCA